MRRRLCAKILLLDPEHRVLLYRTRPLDSSLVRAEFWTPPGGGLDDGESFEQAARRALQKETGIVRALIGAPVAEHTFSLPLPDGDRLLVDERYFLVRTETPALAGSTSDDRRWWDYQTLNSTTERIVPENLGLTLADIIAQ